MDSSPLFVNFKIQRKNTVQSTILYPLESYRRNRNENHTMDALDLGSRLDDRELESHNELSTSGESTLYPHEFDAHRSNVYQ